MIIININHHYLNQLNVNLILINYFPHSLSNFSMHQFFYQLHLHLTLISISHHLQFIFSQILILKISLDLLNVLLLLTMMIYNYMVINMMINLYSLDIKKQKWLADKENMLDYMSSEELGANLSRATQTDAKLQRELASGKYFAMPERIWRISRDSGTGSLFVPTGTSCT